MAGKAGIVEAARWARGSHKLGLDSADAGQCEHEACPLAVFLLSAPGHAGGRFIVCNLCDTAVLYNCTSSLLVTCRGEGSAEGAISLSFISFLASFF